MIENNELRIVVTLYLEVESDISEENKFCSSSTNIWSQIENIDMNDKNERDSNNQGNEFNTN